MRRRTLVTTTILLGAAALAVTAWYLRRMPPGPAAPAVELTDDDPAVADAINQARLAVSQAPRSALAWGHLGLVFLAHDFHPEALACFAQAERLDDGDSRWPYFQGSLLSLGNPDAAIPKFQRAADLNAPAVDTPRLRLAELLLGQGRLDEAEPHLRQLLKQNSGHALAYLDLARLAYARGDAETSLGLLAQAADSPYTRRAGHRLMAEIYQGRGDPAAAARELDLAEHHLPADLPWPDPFLQQIDQCRVGKRAHFNHADQLLSQGRVDQAIDELEETVQAYPDADAGWHRLGMAHLFRGELAAAEQALRTAVRLAPERAEFRFSLGAVLFEKGDMPAAAASFRKATELRADHAEAYYHLGRCLLRQGERQKAIEAFAAAVRYKPSYVEAHTDLGELLIQDGRPDEALTHLRFAVQLNPSDPRAQELLKQVQDRGGTGRP